MSVSTLPGSEFLQLREVSADSNGRVLPWSASAQDGCPRLVFRNASESTGARRASRLHGTSRTQCSSTINVERLHGDVACARRQQELDGIGNVLW